MAKSIEMLLIDYASREARGHPENSLPAGNPHFCVHPDLYKRITAGIQQKQAGEADMLAPRIMFTPSPFMPRDSIWALNPAAGKIIEQMKLAQLLER